MKLSHEVWGEGPLALVALHGFTGNRNAWRHLTPAWSPHCRVLAVDLPGHGETPLSAEVTFSSSVDALIALLREKGFEKATLLGYSLGARVALAAATRAPELFGRLVLESGSPGLTRRKARNERRREDEDLARSIEQGGVKKFVERWEALPIFSGLTRLPAPTQEDLRTRRLASSAEGLAGSLRALGLGVQPNLWPGLHRLRVPTLLLTGERDPKFTAIARRMASELPMAWRHTFSGAGHAPHLEVADEYAAEVLQFLQTPWHEETPADAEHGRACT